MSQHKKTVFTFIVGVLTLMLAAASTANAQEGYFEGQYAGVREAAGAGLTLVQRGQQVGGRLMIDGAVFVVEAMVSGTSGYGVVGNPSTGATQPFALNLVGGGLVVATAGQIFQFRRGGGGFQRGGGGASPADEKTVDFEDRVADFCARNGGCPF